MQLPGAGSSVSAAASSSSGRLLCGHVGPRHVLRSGRGQVASAGSSSHAAGAVVAAAAAAAAAAAPADLIRWPEGTRPKRGAVTKAALTRLKAAELRAELARLGADSSGSKEQLAEKLLHLITAAAAEHQQHRQQHQQQPPSPPPPPPPPGRLSPAIQAAAAPAAAAASGEPPAVLSRGTAGQQGQAGRRAAAAANKARSSSGNGATAAAAGNPLQAASLMAAADELAHAAHAILSRAAPPAPQLERSSSSSSSSSGSSNGGGSSSNGSGGSSSSSRGSQAAAAASSRARPGETPPPRAHDASVQPGCMPPLDEAEAAEVAAAAGVSLGELPPLVAAARGHVYSVADMAALTPAEQELVLKACRGGLVLTLLGGAFGDAAAGEGPPPSLGLVREKDVWLFDVGEDVQRALMWREHLKPSKMHRIVISRQAPDAMLGLPGVLCVIGASREKGHEVADIPVHVFGPEGTAQFLAAMYSCSDTFLEMPVVVHEFVSRAVSEEEMEPQPLSDRAKLWRVLLPPDQLNPHGCVEALLEGFMPTQGRARVKKGARAAGGVLSKNPRAGYRPFPTPPPGSPAAAGSLPRAGLTWTVIADEAAMMTAVSLDAPDPTWGIVWREADRQGNLSIPRCEAFGVTDGELYGLVKNGEAVPNRDGLLIPAPLLCSQDKPGRKVVLLPACDSAEPLARHAAGADVMFGDAAAAAAAGGGQLGVGLGVVAQQWGVRHLVVTGMPGPAPGRPRPGHQSRSSRSRRSSSNSDGDGDGDERPAQQQQLGAAAAGVLSVVSEQFTAGLLLPGRDNLSLVVEENMGPAAPPPLDIDEKVAAARASVLVITEVSAQQRQQQRQQAGQRGGGGRGGGRGGSSVGGLGRGGSGGRFGWQQQQQRHRQLSRGPPR